MDRRHTLRVGFEDMAQILPPDALYLIFDHACPSRVDEVSPKVLTLSPMNFANVCRSWREVVAERSSLWGHLNVDIHSLESINHRVVQVVETWLQNSKAAPLNLSLKFRLVCTSRNPEFESLVSRILSQAHRWKDVVFQIHYPFLQEFLGEFSLPPMPLLVSLWFGQGADAEKMVTRFDASCCQHVQSLTLRFGVKMGLLGKEQFHLDSLNVLSLYVDNSCFEDFRRILQSSPNLSELDIFLSGSSGSDQLPYPKAETLSLPNLAHLTLVDENRALIVRLLNGLTCPNLRQMSIENTFSKDAQPEIIYVITV